MMKKIFFSKSALFLILLAIFFFYDCKKSVNWKIECDQTEEQIFNTDFSDCEIYEFTNKSDKIRSTDTTESGYSVWDELQSHHCIGNFHISYEDGEREQRFAEICPDPQNNDNQVLKFKIIEPHIREGTHKKGRVQANLHDNQCIKEFYQKVKLYIHPDMEFLKQWDEQVHWLSFFEFWNNANWDGERNPFRVTVNMIKNENGPVENMYFAAKGDRDIRLGGWDPVWYETADNFSVPFGSWMEIEIYLLEGDEKNGRFYMAVTPERGEKIVLFDVHNTTQHPREKFPDGYTHINALKLYTSDEIINYLNNNGKALEIYWDDWEFGRNIQHD
jgi:hypothetical protein